MIAHRRPRRVHSGLIIGACALGVALIGFGAWTLMPHSIGSSGPEPGMAIALVAPREPILVAGPVLEVGALNDGFDRAALDRRPATEDVEFLPADAYVGEEPTAFQSSYEPAASPIGAVPALEPSPVVDPLADGSRSFGFDRQRPAGSVQAAVMMQDLAAASSPEQPRRSENFFQ